MDEQTKEGQVISDATTPATPQETAIENWTELSYKQVEVIRFLLEGKSVEQAARLVELSPAAVYKWLRNDEPFKVELAQMRKEHYSTRVLKAGQVFDELLEHNDDKIRLKAATEVIRADALYSVRNRNANQTFETINKLRLQASEIDDKPQDELNTQDAIILDEQESLSDIPDATTQTIDDENQNCQVEES